MTSVEIRRFGPIYRGEIDLAPLTVLVGPNGSGKSYAAMVLHSLSQSRNQRGRRVLSGRPAFLADSFLRDENSLTDAELRELEECGKALDKNGEAPLRTSTFNKIVEYYYEVFFERRLNDILESVFATDLQELIKKGRHRSFRFDIKTALGNSRLDCYSTYDGVEIKEVPQVNIDPLLKKVESRFESGNEKSLTIGEQGRLVIPIEEIHERYSAEYPESILISLINSLQFHTDLRYQSGSHYLPAGRAGLLQSHEVLTTGAIDRLSRVGLEPIEVPAFSGVVSSYLGEIVSLSRRDPGKLADLAKQFESNVLNGEVLVERDENEPRPKITFEQEGNEFQLHIASTSVSELAPLILYTKYILSPNSTIVIEEPEAHLHPENQRKIAYFIVRLVNAGVRVIVTTHSDFVLEQMNNLIRLSEINKEKVEEAGLSDLPSVSPSDVSANMFSYDAENNGYRISKLEINAIDGISMEEFGKVSEALYGEGFKIDKLLQEDLNRRS